MTSRYEVTGNSDIGLPVETTMAVASMLGTRLADAFAPADGAIGKIQATISTGIEWIGSDATEENRHIQWDQLIQDPIDAKIKTDTGPGAVGPGDIELLAPGEWTVNCDVRFGKTAYTGDNECNVIVTVRDSDGNIIRQKNASLPLGASRGTISARLDDALVLPEHLPATVDVWFKTGRWRGIWGGAIYTDFSAKKTTRYATETDFASADEIE